MKRLSVALMLIYMLLASSTLNAFASEINSGYSYDDGIMSFDLESFDMVPFRKTDDAELKEDEQSSMFYAIFEETPSAKMVVLPKSTKYYWYLGVRDGKELSSLSDFSEDEIRSFNLSDYSESEILDVFSDYQIEGFNKDWDDTGVFNDMPYYVVAGSATQNGVSQYVMQYLTVINGYYYVFTLYPLSDEFNEDDLSGFHDFMNSIEYKTQSEASESVDEQGASSDETADTQDRKDSLMTSLMTVIPVAIIFAVITAIVKSRKKKINSAEQSTSEDIGAVAANEEIVDSAVSTAPENTQMLSIQADPAEELRKYKQMLDDGLITQEDYDKLKAKTLNL